VCSLRDDWRERNTKEGRKEGGEKKMEKREEGGEKEGEKREQKKGRMKREEMFPLKISISPLKSLLQLCIVAWGSQ